MNIYEYRALDPAATRLRHAAPVLEGIGNQCIGGDHGYGLVPVSYLNRSQRNLFHRAVGAILIHLDPITRTDHTVSGQLNSGYETENGVPENQHDQTRHHA